jgi:acetolactate synthase-1/2/3 large subunit
VSAAKLAVARDIQKVQPQLAYLEAIREALPRDGIFCDEITQCGFASWYGFPIYRPRSHINCGYQGTLGYGFATALGVKVAHPDKPVVAIAGDGGFMFNVQELATAVQYKIGLVTVIFNSNSFTNVKRQQQEWFGNRIIASDLVNPDFVKLAQSFGAAGLRVNSPKELREALRKAFAEPGPTLIEVPVGQMASPWEFIILPPLATAVREAS